MMIAANANCEFDRRFPNVKDVSDEIFDKVITSLSSEVADHRILDRSGQPMLEPFDLAASTQRASSKKTPGSLTTYVSLPDDVKMLVSAPHEYDNDASMAAIRKILVEQRRENSRLILPELSPAIAPETLDLSGSENSYGRESTSVIRKPTLSVGLACLVASPKDLRKVHWLMLGLALLAINPLLFLVLASVSAISMLMLSVFFGLLLILEQLSLAMRPRPRNRSVTTAVAGKKNRETIHIENRLLLMAENMMDYAFLSGAARILARSSPTRPASSSPQSRSLQPSSIG